MMEGSGSESRYKPLTNGSGSERPKNLRTLRIRNIGKKQKYLEKIYLFLVSILKANKERPGTASGSVIQWYGSADLIRIKTSQIWNTDSNPYEKWTVPERMELLAVEVHLTEYLWAQ
jgi:hypothetical protein